MLVALKTIAAQRSKSTQEIAKKVVQILNYAATHPEEINRYHASGMTLHMHSDASFLSAPWSKSRYGRYHYLSEPSSDPRKPLHKPPPLNGPIHEEFTIMKNILESAMEAELGALFVNYQQGAALRIALEEMGHHQPPITVVTDSATRDSFVKDNIRQSKSKAIDMRLYWVRDRVRQEHYIVYWERLKDNLADYFTKTFPTKHHRDIRGTYLVPTAVSSNHAYYQVPSDLQGCVKSPPAQETDDGQTRSHPPTNGISTDRDGQATRYRRR